MVAVAVVAVLILSAYSAVEISDLRSDISSLQDQLAYDQQSINSLQSSLNNLETRVTETATAASTPTYGISILSACVSSTPFCPGAYDKTSAGLQRGDVYWVQLEDGGTQPVPVNSSIFVGIRDYSRLTSVGFNTTVPAAVPPGGYFVVNGTSWPAGTGGASKLSPGDIIVVTVLLGPARASVSGTVYSCSYTTATFVNASTTETQTVTSCG